MDYGYEALSWCDTFHLPFPFGATKLKRHVILNLWVTKSKNESKTMKILAKITG